MWMQIAPHGNSVRNGHTETQTYGHACIQMKIEIQPTRNVNWLLGHEGWRGYGGWWGPWIWQLMGGR